MLVPQALVHRCDRVGLEHRFDPLVVLVDGGVGEAAGPGVDQLGEPPPDECAPLGLGQRRATGDDPGLLGLGHVLPDGLGVRAQAGGHHHFRAAGVPVHQQLDDVLHVKTSPCQQRLALLGG